MAEPGKEAPVTFSHYKVKRVSQETELFTDYLAEQQHLAKTVRLRLFRHPFLYQPQVFKVLRSHQRDLSKLVHPLVAPILEIGMAQKILFMAQEYPPGERLSDWVAANRPLPMDCFSEFSAQLVESFVYLQSQNVSWQRLEQADFTYYERKLILRELNPLEGIRPLCQRLGKPEVKFFLDQVSGAFFVAHDFDFNANMKHTGELLYSFLSSTPLPIVLAEAKGKAASKLLADIPAELARIIVKTQKTSTSGGFESLFQLKRELAQARPKLVSVPRPATREEARVDAAMPEPLLDRPAPVQAELEDALASARVRTRKRRAKLKILFVIAAVVLIFLGFQIATSLLRFNKIPEARVSPATAQVEVNKPLVLDASESTDPDGDELSYHWRVIEPVGMDVIFNPVEPKKARRPSAIFLHPGSYRLQLRVFDGHVESDPVYVEVEVK